MLVDEEMSSKQDVLSDEEKAEIVKLIIYGRTDEALIKLSDVHGVSPPRIKIGRVKGKSGAPAVYVAEEKTIYLQDGGAYTNPVVILHEFYHHIRMGGGKHRGTESYANKYAINFIKAYIERRSLRG